MKGLCQSCKRVDDLYTCQVCGARVCIRCLEKFGCKLCRGVVRI